MKKSLKIIYLILIISVIATVFCGCVETSPTTTEANSLADVQRWYEKQTAAVSQALMDYSKSINGLTSLNVNSSRFFFGGDWNDCYYKFTFTCNVDGENYLGEARAFLKHQDSVVNWFSFEIFDNDGIQSLVEHYDDNYDTIIEDYYKELAAQYK